MNINVKLVGFKPQYNIENSDDYRRTITLEHRYNVLKRKIEIIENKEIEFN